MADEARESTPSGFIHLVGNVLDGLSGEYFLTHIRYPKRRHSGFLASAETPSAGEKGRRREPAPRRSRNLAAGLFPCRIE
jgi:hypothetical protein